MGFLERWLLVFAVALLLALIAVMLKAADTRDEQRRTDGRSPR